ncbi:MAG: hypothetical protein DBX47_02570 [Clostridiales bacterium]|nr:MAG: hypothetical protein DBX47_02570 [Clostridiales bacterium]
MAGFFKYNDKEGQGVSKSDLAAPAYIRFFKIFFLRIANMVGLNLLYIFCCLPIITIGPATAGFTYVLRNYSQGKHVDLFYDFMRKAKEHFKDGVIITVIDIVIGILLYFSIQSWMTDYTGSIRTVALVVLFFVVYIVACVNLYIFPMLVSFDIPLKKLIRNSVLLATGKIWRNLAMVAVNGGAVLLLLITFPLLVPLYLFLIFSFCGLFNNFMVYPVLVKHVAEPVTVNDDQQPEDDKVFKDPH